MIWCGYGKCVSASVHCSGETDGWEAGNKTVLESSPGAMGHKLPCSFNLENFGPRIARLLLRKVKPADTC